MKFYRYIVFVVSIIVLSGSITSSASALPAFPGAEGFGSETIGGRGGDVYIVTSLADDGPGTLREAVEAEGPRTVVFQVSGTIVLEDALVIKDPFITIAGQTSPNGIVLRNSPLIIAIHDVVVRGLRLRIGDDPDGYTTTSRDGVNISSSANNNQEIYNVIVDHNSISWGVDENTSIWTDQVHDATYSWNIISEALHCSIHIDEGDTNPDCHSMGMLLGHGQTNLSIHHNLLAHNNDRNPLVFSRSLEIVNNVVYNWGNGAANFGSTASKDPNPKLVNIVGNTYIPGVNTRTDAPRDRGIRIDEMNSGSSFYINDNIGPNRSVSSQPETDAVFLNTTEAIFVDSPAMPFGVSTIDTQEVAFDKVLAKAGALSPTRDAIDTRIVDDVRNQTGQVIDSQDDVGGWLTIADTNQITDSDQDGIPDEWEETEGTNKNLADSDGDIDSNGYTNIEDYINSFYMTQNQPTPTPTATPQTCTADLNGDLVIDITDYTILSGNFLSTNPIADINNDGVVDILDYTILAANFLKTC